MKGFPLLLIATALAASLTGGCSKKSKATLPATETEPAAPVEASPGTAAEPTSGEQKTNTANSLKTNETPTAATAPMAIEGVPADLVAADAAYETWFKKHGLDLNDPKMLDEDPDGDGFSNREEFLADTDPRDANSRPGVAKEMHLKEFVRKELPYLLKSVQGENAQIERGEEGAPRKMETVKQGQMLGGSNYKVIRVESRPSRDKDGNPVDGSRVTLEDGGTKQRVDLVKDLPSRSTASYAVIAGADGKTVTVHEGETFTWPSEPPVMYKVKDLRAEQVILEDLASRKVVTVAKEK